jgi:tetratricopeptide (TPR) repeat protein
MRQYHDALADLNRAIELTPDDAWAIGSRGETYREMARYNDALVDFTRAIELRPDDAWATAGRGETYRLMRRYNNALADLNRAIELAPDDAWAFSRRGEIFREMAFYDDALVDFTRAIELRPDDAWATAGRGETLREMARYNDALVDFTRAIELRPDDAWATASRGETYRLMRRYNDALVDFARAIELDPDDAWAFSRRGATYRALERHDNALADLNRAIELDPDDAWAISLRGATYRALERHDNALPDATRLTDPTGQIGTRWGHSDNDGDPPAETAFGWSANKFDNASMQTDSIDVSIYLDTDDEGKIQRITQSVDKLVDLLGFDGPLDIRIERGSFIRFSRGKIKKALTSDELKARLSNLERIVELHGSDNTQAHVDSDFADVYSKLLAALDDVPCGCIRAGSTLIVKYYSNGQSVVLGRKLTVTEIAAFEAYPEIQMDPSRTLEILALATEKIEGRQLKSG